MSDRIAKIAQLVINSPHIRKLGENVEVSPADAIDDMSIEEWVEKAKSEPTAFEPTAIGAGTRAL